MTRPHRLLAVTLVSVFAPLAGAGAAAHAGEPVAKPPAIFLELGKSITDAGFHTDDRYPDGWTTGTVCHFDDTPKACTLMTASWQSVVVADKKSDGSAVVQELWLFDFANAGDAKAGLRSLEHDFEWGPFNKHPYHLFRCGARVIGIEGRFRWSTARKQLRKHVETWLADHCDADAAAAAKP
jgi:hypothetical protein